MIKAISLKLFLIFLLFFFFTFKLCKKRFRPNRPLGAEGKRVRNIEEGRGAKVLVVCWAMLQGEQLINLVVLILCGEPH